MTRAQQRSRSFFIPQQHLDLEQAEVEDLNEAVLAARDLAVRADALQALIAPAHLPEAIVRKRLALATERIEIGWSVAGGARGAARGGGGSRSPPAGRR